MGKKVFMQTQIWEKPDFLSMSIEQRYLYLYLLSNPGVSYCGIYKLDIEVAATHTGYTYTAFASALSAFVAEFPAVAETDPATGEVAIKTWPELHFRTLSPKGRGIVLTDIDKVESEKLLTVMAALTRGGIAQAYNKKARARRMQSRHQVAGKAKKQSTHDPSEQTLHLRIKSAEPAEKQGVNMLMYNTTNTTSLLNNNVHNISSDQKFEKTENVVPSKTDYNKFADAVIDDLNSYRPPKSRYRNTETNRKWIRARLDEKADYTFKTFRQVNWHASIKAKWYGFEYMRPSTLYNRDRFESYALEAAEELEKIKNRKQAPDKPDEYRAYLALVAWLRKNVGEDIIKDYRHLTFSEYLFFHADTGAPVGTQNQWLAEVHREWASTLAMRRKYALVRDAVLARWSARKIQLQTQSHDNS